MKAFKLLLSIIALTVFSVSVFAQKEEINQKSTLWSQTSDGPGINIVSVTQRDAGDLDIVVDVTGVQSMEALGDPLNEIVTTNLGDGASLTGVGWDVTITTIGGSYLSEAKIYFDGSDQDGTGLFLTPGVNVNSAGTGTYTSAVIDLTDNGISDIPILADGLLYMEFYEGYNDNAGSADATWSGTITLRYAPAGGAAGAVPTMSQYGLIFFVLALGIIGLVKIRKS